MPQFDPSSFASQLFWLYITFGLLIVLLSTIAMPKIGTVLEERQRKIDDNLDKAGTLKAEAETAIATYEKALSDSRLGAQALLKTTAEESLRRSVAAHKALAEKMLVQVKAGERRITAAKDEALHHIAEVAGTVAQLAVAKLADIAVDDSTVTVAIAAVIKEEPR